MAVFYIGITTNLEERKRKHLYMLSTHKHPNYKIQHDYDKYGIDSFIFEQIDELDTTKEEAYQHEHDLIQQYHATEFYNISEGELINPVYCPQVVEKLKKIHQEKYPDILQYKFEDNNFVSS